MALTNFIVTVVGVGAAILLFRGDVKQSATVFRRNLRHIRHWLEEESGSASKLRQCVMVAASFYIIDVFYFIPELLATPHLWSERHPKSWTLGFRRRTRSCRIFLSVFQLFRMGTSECVYMFVCFRSLE
ncbi:hypothetical protein MUK42_14161 [Musa troglodytarum]|uniref:Uncharacterized protein n=1 Tax=Musa troglodytarum TaxID=320322 RepID=A0A9E7JWX6_9LILI|nr:hypothetical protein MUK42_14161 [Musa troglodytarum]